MGKFVNFPLASGAFFYYDAARYVWKSREHKKFMNESAESRRRRHNCFFNSPSSTPFHHFSFHSRRHNVIIITIIIAAAPEWISSRWQPSRFIYKSSLNILKISSTPAASAGARVSINNLLYHFAQLFFRCSRLGLSANIFPMERVISILKRREQRLSFSFGWWRYWFTHSSSQTLFLKGALTFWLPTFLHRAPPVRPPARAPRFCL